MPRLLCSELNEHRLATLEFSLLQKTQQSLAGVGGGGGTSASRKIGRGYEQVIHNKRTTGHKREEEMLILLVIREK